MGPRVTVPNPGAPHELDSDTRIVAFDCERLGRMYQVEVRFGPVEFQAHGGPHHDYAEALAQAHRVARREQDTREDTYVAAEPDHQPDSYAFREARLLEVDYCGPGDMRLLSDRIKRGRRRVGWR